MIKYKKGLTTVGTVAAIALMVALVFFISFKFFPGIAQAAQTTSSLLDSGNCDLDDAINVIDDCPCLSNGGLEGSIRGCPLGTSTLEAGLDKQTCKWYVTSENSCGGLGSTVCRTIDGTTFYSNCDGKNKEKCVESDGNFKTRCDLVSETAISVQSKKGLAGNWDLMPSILGIEDESFETLPLNEGVFDLHGQANSQQLTVSIEVDNIGSEDIKPYTVSIEICNDLKEKESCQTKASIAMGSLEANGISETVDKKITVGENGDSCDGPGDTKCYLRVVADSDNKYAELDENNNYAWYYIALNNKKGENIDWQTYASIEIFGDAGGTPDTKAQIKQECPGFIGEIGGCPSEGNDCDAPDHPDKHSVTYPISGCLVHATEHNLISSNSCAWAGVKKGFILQYLSFSNLDLSTGISGDEGAKDLFTYKWQALPSGSLICEDQQWYQCDKDRNDKYLVIGGERFKCKDGNWEKQ